MLKVLWSLQLVETISWTFCYAFVKFLQNCNIFKKYAPGMKYNGKRKIF